MKTCAHCGTQFSPARPLATVCSPICASRLVRQRAKEKKAHERTMTKARKEAVKPRAKWLAEAQQAVNLYVRLRDANKGCCSCDLPASWSGQWHASHLRSVGAASAVRFHLWNIAKSCSICNNHKSGNLAEYLPRHVERIGRDRVDWLMSQNQLVRYDIPYLKRLKQVFQKKAKRMERRCNAV